MRGDINQIGSGEGEGKKGGGGRERERAVDYLAMSMTSLSVAVRLWRASMRWNTTPSESLTYGVQV